MVSIILINHYFNIINLLLFITEKNYIHLHKIRWIGGSDGETI